MVSSYPYNTSRITGLQFKKQWHFIVEQCEVLYWVYEELEIL
jgi:hypothetical protein